MTGYILRRLLQAVPLLLIISAVVFALIEVAPNRPVVAVEQNPSVSPEDLVRLEQELGLGDPLPVRYSKWLGRILGGDWGESLVTGRPVLTEIAERLPNTLYLSGIALALALVISIPLGMLAALRQYSLFDHVVTTIAFVGQSIPLFWFGLILIIIFSVHLQNPLAGTPLFPQPPPLPLFPGGGMATLGQDTPHPLIDRLWHLVLPVTMLAFFQLAQHIRYIRAGMLDVLKLDYVRTAHAKGLGARTVALRHAFKNAAIPLVTILALEIPSLFNGALFAETIFSWPGMGRLFLRHAERGDYPVLMGILLMSGALVILFNLIADIAYAYLDPRVRYSR